MNRRTEIDSESDDAKPTAALTYSGVRRMDNVIPFSRANSAVSYGPAASGLSSADELDAFFISVGEAVAAVVLRLRDGFPRIRCDRPSNEEEECWDGLS